MSGMEDSIKETMDRVWLEGIAAGLSDDEIIQMIENVIQEKMRTQDRTRTPRRSPLKGYKPMTDEEIRESQRKLKETEPMKSQQETEEFEIVDGDDEFEIIGESGGIKQARRIRGNQALYAPPPFQKPLEIHEVYGGVDREILYGPPPFREPQDPPEEMFEVYGRTDREILYGPPPFREPLDPPEEMHEVSMGAGMQALYSPPPQNWETVHIEREIPQPLYASYSCEPANIQPLYASYPSDEIQMMLYDAETDKGDDAKNNGDTTKKI